MIDDLNNSISSSLALMKVVGRLPEGTYQPRKKMIRPLYRAAQYVWYLVAAATIFYLIYTLYK